MNEHITKDLERIEAFVLRRKTAIMILGDIPYDPNSKGLYWIPMMYFSARSGGCIKRHYGFLGNYVGLDGNMGEGFFQDDYYVGMHEHWNFKPYWMDNNPHVSDDELNRYAHKSIQPISGAILDDNSDFTVKDLFELNNFSDVQGAFLKARQARFEHGETPTT